MAPRGKKGGSSRQTASLTMDDDELDDIDMIEQPKHVSLDLQSSDESEDDSEEDSEMEVDDKQNKDEQDDEEDDDEEDDEEEDSEEDSDDDVDAETVWGRSSSQYYAGDTADLEIGQDFEEAKEEEAIAAKLQKKKRSKEDESDYLILDENAAGDHDEDDDEEGDDDWKGAKSLRDVSKLDDAAQLKVIMAESPELKGLLDQMKKYLDELSLLGLALDEAHMGQAEAVTEEGLAYLELRNHLLLSFVMNVNFYLLLKAEKKQVRDHPVVAKLLKLQKAINKLTPLEEKGEQAVGYLVQKAAEEVYGEGDEDEDEEDDEEEDVEGEVEEENEEEEDEEEEDEEENDMVAKKLRRAEEKRRKMELKFEKKSSALTGEKGGKKRKTASALLGSDSGDIESNSAPRLQAMMNTMIQKQKSKKVKTVGGDEDVPVSEVKAKKQSLVGSNEMEGYSDHDEDEGEQEDEGSEEGSDEESVTGNQFYEEAKAVAAAKLQKRKDKYGSTREVAGSHLKELSEDAKRATPYQIMKNRGLVAHKSKINRNPRVKKREQFRKATIRRKGQVRDVRDSAEGANYQGETTGIRTGISRSRAITN